MIAEIIATLGMIYDFADDHPDIVRMLADEARKLLGGHEPETLANREAQRALAAGMAAARANAVQEFVRRQKKAAEHTSSFRVSSTATHKVQFTAPDGFLTVATVDDETLARIRECYRLEAERGK